MTYTCSCCGERHEGIPDVAFDRPVYAQQVPEPERERERRVQLDADLCVIDDEDCFIRGVIEIPVRDHDDLFGIGVWVSQKRENFLTYREQFDTDAIGPFFGWLSNDFLFGGERTLNLKTMAHFRGGGQRPRIIVEPGSHPLASAQEQGLSLDDIWRFVHGTVDVQAP